MPALRVPQDGLRLRIPLAFALICLLGLLATAPSALARGLPTLGQQRGGVGATFPNGAPLPDALPVDGHSLSVSSVAVTSLQAGETLQASAQAEVTDDVIVRARTAGFRWLNMPLTSELVLADNPEATTGTILAPSAGGTVSWREHHAAVVRSGLFTVPSALQGHSLYVNLVLRSAPRAVPNGCYTDDRAAGVFLPSAGGCALDVENDDGLVDLTVTRTPPAGRTAYAARLTAGSPRDTYLPIPPSPSSPGYGHQFVVWSSGPVRNIQAGDVLQASAQVQASIQSLIRSIPAPNSATTGCNVMLDGQLLLSPYPGRLPGPGDPLGNAVPALGDDYSFNLTQDQPQTLAAFRSTWTADGDYTSAQAPVRYVVLAVWAAGSQACQRAVSGSDPGLHIEPAGSGGFVIHLLPASDTSWDSGWSLAGGNAATRFPRGAGRTVLAVAPVRLRPGDILAASAQAAITNAATADTGVELVLAPTYDGPSDVSGTPLSEPGQSVIVPGSDRSLMTLAGAGQATVGGLEYVKLVGWSSSAAAVGVDTHATQLLVQLVRAGSMPAMSRPSPTVTNSPSAASDRAMSIRARAARIRHRRARRRRRTHRHGHRRG